MSEGILINPNLTVYFATITVYYPAGSTVTCTNGNYSLTAETTSGAYTFTVPYAGTWGIWSTNGVQSKGAYVDVTYYNQSASVALTYETNLYNYGDQCSWITGNWVKTKGALTTNPNTLFIHGNGNECGIVQTAAGINLAPYSTLYALVDSSGTNYFRIGTTNTTAHTTGGPSGVTAQTQWSGRNTDVTISLSVAHISDASNFVFVYSHAYETNVGVTIKRIWLV